jgi:U3 small nucleolar RNA-associated protein 14
MAKKRTLPKLRTKEKSHPKKSISKSRAIHSDEEDENMHGSSLKVGGKYHQEVDEDDSIDDEGSEIGWNSDDEAAYGQLFHKKPTDEDDDDDEEEEIEGGILLSDMLSSSNQTTSQPLTSHQSEDEGEEEPSFSGSEDEDEEDDSENEYAYDDEDDDEGDHDKLLAAIEKYSKPAQPPTLASRSNSKAFQLSTESPFSTLQSNQTISLESLLNSLENPSSSTSTSLTGIDQDTLKSVKTNLRSLNSSVTAPKYTHKVQSERAERGVTYEQTSTDMKKWQTLVRDNQVSKSLDLRQDKRSLPSTRTMITSFQPQTEMEKEISMILLNPNSTAQHNEQDIERNEEDELLHSKELTHEEIKEKQKELSKIKSLLFFEQMKRHRINKIKSKTFHRILKKRKLKKKMTSQEYNEMVQKLRKNGELLDEDLDEFGEDEDGEGRGEKESEEEAIRRIKERMDLRHKNTGKWARMALEHGKGSKSLR